MGQIIAAPDPVNKPAPVSPSPGSHDATFPIEGPSFTEDAANPEPKTVVNNVTPPNAEPKK